MIRFLVILLIALICGSIGARIAGSGGRGCLMGTMLGFYGAVIGGWLSKQLEIPDVLYIKGFPLVWSIIGAAVFVAALNLISGRGMGKKK